MRKLVAISLFLLAAFAFERADILLAKPSAESCALEQHTVHIESGHRHYDDAERCDNLIVPSARILTTNSNRAHTFRSPHISATGHFHTISKYVVARFTLRLGSLPRAVDFYLYTLCQLRL